MTGKVQWICEACDSSNSVEVGEPAVCRFCRLTYDVKIEDLERPAEPPGAPVVEAAVELLNFESEREGRNRKPESDE